jgi:hypothetical protein
MPYKAKDCPTCGTTHTKRGLYCSRSCGNHRIYTKEQRLAKSVALTKHLTSDAESAVTQRWIIAEVGKRSREKHTNPDAAERNYDDYNVIPARLPDGNTFVADGALWREEE